MAKGGFSGGRMGGGMNMNMLKQAQKMQQEMMKKQEEIEEKEFTSSSGGGMVTATVNGKHEILSLKIDESAIIEAESAEDAEMIADAVIAAVNDAMSKATEEMAQTLGKLTGSGLF